jgi:hypothetical protein
MAVTVEADLGLRGLLAGEVESRFAAHRDVMPAAPGARIGRLTAVWYACASEKPGP